MKGKLKENKQFSVLLADDDREDTRRFLNAFGKLTLDIDVHTVRNGKEILDFLATNNFVPDVLFLDLHMPVMDGRDCLKKIRQDERYRDLCICIFSTSEESEVEELLIMGANVCIKKPRDVEALQHILYKVISFNGHCQEPYLKRDFFMLSLGI